MSMYRLVAVLVLSVYLLSPSMIDSWSNMERPWYTPFLIWLTLIVMVAWLEHKRSGHDV